MESYLNEKINKNNSVSNEDSEKQQKKAKKKEKKSKRDRDENPEEEQVDSNQNGEDLEDEEERKRKKKAKKEAKKLKKLQQQQDDEAEADDTTSNFKVSKSSSSGNYIESTATASMTSPDVDKFRTQHSIQIFPEEESLSFKPITEFSSLYPSIESDCPYIIDYLKKKNFKTPSPIQAQCWPPLLQGRDAIGIAATGSGKTLAFLIPAILKITKFGPKIMSKNSVPMPRILIVSPTRELAVQSHDVAVEVGGPMSVCIYGGVPKHEQKSLLRQGADIVVATPGRLLDLIEENALNLSGVCYLVLDEADRMLDEGFEPTIRKIVAGCPPIGQGIGKRQTVMFSATWPEEIRQLATTFLSPDVVRVVVGSTELSANHRVTQIVECIEAYDKNKRLLQLLEKYHQSRKNRCLIFVLYKKEAVVLQNTLQGKGYNVTAIHGDRSQYERSAALEAFKKGDTPLLIATDVAARGLDIPQVEYVINYSFPLTVEDYVHRIGRTGRGGATGVSHTFFCDSDKTLAGALVAVLQEAKQEVPQDIFKYSMVTKKKQSKLYGDFGPKQELAGLKAKKIVFD